MCKHSEQGTPKLLWLGEHAGQDKASHEAAPVTDSNEASPDMERCRSSIGLRDKMVKRRLAIKNLNTTINTDFTS